MSYGIRIHGDSFLNAREGIPRRAETVGWNRYALTIKFEDIETGTLDRVKANLRPSTCHEDVQHRVCYSESTHMLCTGVPMQGL